ncbi:MAG: hypothetical protein K1X74_22690 [Pirellulales bacterium]|nr:hypothetical protein [Pirellulales bacterium]
MLNRSRQKLFVDPRVQGALMLRTVTYWFCCLLTITTLVLCWRIMFGSARVFYKHFDEMWFQLGPALVASLFVLPLVLIDVLRLSNRFVGPIVRFRQALRTLAQGGQIEPLHFREGDFWHELSEELNALNARLQHSELAGLAKTSGEQEVFDEDHAVLTH